MKQILLTTLRNRRTTLPAYRDVARKLGALLAIDAAQYLPQRKVAIQTPVSSTQGYTLKYPIVLVPILRAGLALLPPFLDLFPDAKVGLFGIERDEMTAVPTIYYQKLPDILPHEEVLILDPMIATGNSACAAVEILKKQKIEEQKIVICSIIGSSDGLAKIKECYPKIRLVTLHEDETLNSQNFIEPGLGDFGDRYFGTEI